jgi:hypothetical protein
MRYLVTLWTERAHHATSKRYSELHVYLRKVSRVRQSSRFSLPVQQLPVPFPPPQKLLILVHFLSTPELSDSERSGVPKNVGTSYSLLMDTPISALYRSTWYDRVLNSRRLQSRLFLAVARRYSFPLLYRTYSIRTVR